MSLLATRKNCIYRCKGQLASESKPAVNRQPGYIRKKKSGFGLDNFCQVAKKKNFSDAKYLVAIFFAFINFASETDANFFADVFFASDRK